MAEKKKKKKKSNEAKLALAANQKKKSKYNVNTKKANQINSSKGGGEEKLKFLRWQQKKKRSKLIPKGRSISNNTAEQQMDIVDQEAIEIHIDEEINMEILSRLSVRSLLRFKCVSKFWKTLISDPYFRMKHRNHAKNDQKSDKLLIGQRCVDKDDMFNFYCSSLSSVQVVEDEQKLGFPSNCNPVCCKIYCSCDGFVLLTVTDRLVEHLLLWNPSTRESIVLPYPESSLKDCVCGLGYDATSDDYKILTVNLNTMVRLSVKILSLKSGSWRKIDNYPTGIRRVFGFKDCGMDSLAFVHGAFHWVGRSRNYTIVSFNISNEVFGEIPLLEPMCNISDSTYIEYGISVFRGKLCFYSTYNNMEGGTFKLWVMKNYGVKESWTLSLTLGDTNLYCSGKPKYMFADGVVLLRCRQWGGLGPIYTTSRGPIGLWPQCLTLKDGIVYTESLISPKSLV